MQRAADRLKNIAFHLRAHRIRVDHQTGFIDAHCARDADVACVAVDSDLDAEAEAIVHMLVMHKGDAPPERLGAA